MTVRELQEKLLQFDPDAIIYKKEQHMEKGSVYEPTYIGISEVTVRESTETFTDAFDYDDYTTTVLRDARSSDVDTKKILVI